MKQVTEGGSYLTTYGYDSLDDLTTVTQDPCCEISPTVSLGRLLTADNPETRYPPAPSRHDGLHLR